MYGRGAWAGARVFGSGNELGHSGGSGRACCAEAVLRRPFGGRKAMGEQIRRTIEVAELPNVTVQVIPLDRGGYPLFGPYVLR